MTAFTTAALDLPTFAERDDVTRADLVFYEVDHAGPSYVGHVFLDRPEASAATARDAEHGYAGSFAVFGHGGCYGSEGHCATDARTTDAFDRRLRHPLTPYVKTVTVTDALAPALLDRRCTSITVTVVVEPADAADAPPFGLVRLLTYAG
jgi:hypothetical protein